MNSEPQVLFQRSGWGVPVVIFSILAGLLTLDALFALWDINLVKVVIEGALAGICAGIAWLWREREKTQGVLLAPHHLIIRNGSGTTEEIHIENARVVLATVTAGDVALLRTLDYGKGDEIMPKKAVLVVEHGSESTELHCVKGLTPPRMRELRDDLNGALISARRKFDYPEPAWPS